jgi:ABC-type multidrug transport system fused ATPase/permease subunit
VVIAPFFLACISFFPIQVSASHLSVRSTQYAKADRIWPPFTFYVRLSRTPNAAPYSSRARAAGIGVPEIEFGTLFAFIAYIDMFFGPIRDLSARYTLVQSALSGAERIFQLLDTTEGDTGEPGAASVDPGDAWPKGEEVAFELDGVTFAYKAGTPVLHDVGLFARRGEDEAPRDAALAARRAAAAPHERRRARAGRAPRTHRPAPERSDRG